MVKQKAFTALGLAALLIGGLAWSQSATTPLPVQSSDPLNLTMIPNIASNFSFLWGNKAGIGTCPSGQFVNSLLAVFGSSCNQVQMSQIGGTIGPSQIAGYMAPQVNSGNDVVCALHADSIAGLTCSNASVDATSETAFSTVITIPASAFSYAGRTMSVMIPVQLWYPVSSPTFTTRLRLDSINGTSIYTEAIGGGTGTSVTGALAVSNCNITMLSAPSTAAQFLVYCPTVMANSASNSRNTQYSGSVFYMSWDSTIAHTLLITESYSANTSQTAFALRGFIPFWIN